MYIINTKERMAKHLIEGKTLDTHNCRTHAGYLLLVGAVKVSVTISFCYSNVQVSITIAGVTL
jgi:hypothetical protein